MTAREYIAFSKGVLLELADFDPAFHNLSSSGREPNQRTEFSKDMNDFEEKVLPQLYAKGIRYENPDPDNWQCTMDSMSPIGFGNTYSNMDIIKDETIMVSIRGGDKRDGKGVILINFPKVNYPQFYDYTFVLALLKKVVNYSQPERGYIMSQEFRKKVAKYYEGKELSTLSGKIFVGWLTYSASPAIDKVLPTDVDREVLPNGGTLIVLKQSLPSAESEEDILTATKIQDVLCAHALVN